MFPSTLPAQPPQLLLCGTLCASSRVRLSSLQAPVLLPILTPCWYTSSRKTVCLPPDLADLCIADPPYAVPPDLLKYNHIRPISNVAHYLSENFIAVIYCTVAVICPETSPPPLHPMYTRW